MAVRTYFPLKPIVNGVWFMQWITAIWNIYCNVLCINPKYLDSHLLFIIVYLQTDFYESKNGNNSNNFIQALYKILPLQFSCGSAIYILYNAFIQYDYYKYQKNDFLLFINSKFLYTIDLSESFVNHKILPKTLVWLYTYYLHFTTFMKNNLRCMV